MNEPRKGSAEVVRGSYVVHTRGFGFLVLEDGGSDVFIQPNS